MSRLPFFTYTFLLFRHLRIAIKSLVQSGMVATASQGPLAPITTRRVLLYRVSSMYVRMCVEAFIQDGEGLTGTLSPTRNAITTHRHDATRRDATRRERYCILPPRIAYRVEVNR